MENFNVLSDQFSDGKVRNPKNQICLVNSVWYCEGVTPSEDKMADLLEDIKFSNSVMTIEDRVLKYTMRSTDNLKDFRYLDEGIRRAQLTKKPAVVGGCYSMCKPSECAAAQVQLI